MNSLVMETKKNKQKNPTNQTNKNTGAGKKGIQKEETDSPTDGGPRMRQVTGFGYNENQPIAGRVLSVEGQAGMAPLGYKYPLRDVGVASGAGASCPLICTHTVEAVTSLVVLAGVGTIS